MSRRAGASAVGGAEHRCHATGCVVEVAPKMFMCRRHWKMLPKRLQDKVWATYRPGQEIDKRPSRAYLKASSEAITWLAERECQQFLFEEADR